MYFTLWGGCRSRFKLSPLEMKMPTVQQRRKCAEIRRFYQEDCQGLTMQDARELIQKRFGLDNTAWHRIKGTLSHRVAIRDESPRMASLQETSGQFSAIQKSTDQGYEITIPAGLDEEAKDAFNRVLGVVSQQSEAIMRASTEKAELEARLIKQHNVIKYLKGVIRDTLDVL